MWPRPSPAWARSSRFRAVTDKIPPFSPSKPPFTTSASPGLTPSRPGVTASTRPPARPASPSPRILYHPPFFKKKLPFYFPPLFDPLHRRRSCPALVRARSRFGSRSPARPCLLLPCNAPASPTTSLAYPADGLARLCQAETPATWLPIALHPLSLHHLAPSCLPTAREHPTRPDSPPSLKNHSNACISQKARPLLAHSDLRP